MIHGYEEKPKKNKRTLKKKIRRIISIVILFIFLLLAVAQIAFVYYGFLEGISILVEIVGKASALTIDARILTSICSIEDFKGEPYRSVEARLREVFSKLWEFKPLQFSIIKDINGNMMSILDNHGKILVQHKIPPLVRDLKPLEVKVIRDSKNPFIITAYTPIFDQMGNKVGIFKAKSDPVILQTVFAGIVGMIILLSMLGYIFSLALTRIMTIGITRPLEALNKKIRMVARVEGDITQRITFDKSVKEVEDLTEATNMIMESTGHFVRLLQEKQYRLEEKNQELEAQTEELAAQTEELIALNEDLENAMEQLQDTQIQLVQSEKMASLGQLTAGVAHEINTPLGAINSNTNIIEMVINFLKADMDMENNDKARRLIGKLEKANDTNVLACDRIIKIVHNLKNFSRLDESDFKIACLHEGIDSVLLLSHNLVKHRIKIHKDYGDIPMVKCFPNQLNQVFMNLIVNAAQAIKEKGDIYIKTWSDADNVFIQIRDTGVGIPKKNIVKIFDPGFTTKGVGVGTGLGLSICFKIIHQHSGKISVDSEQDKGTTFTIELPIENSLKAISQEMHHYSLY
ncbi:MAG: hypothetical protein KAX49_16680 [Halanaerobiales bacterium]|nr:hypothetical protein [Halanaerobiales bacterium]